MNLIEFCIKRPAFTIVLSLIITVIGIIAYGKLAVRWIPEINPPFISVYTNYPGASANLVESEVTTPIEAALASVDGIDTISSRSNEGTSFINIEFKLGRNLNSAIEDVRSALQTISAYLPLGVKQPSIQKADPNSMPIMFLAFFDSHRSEKEVSDYIKQFIMPRLQSTDGVASIVTYGERISAMRIWLDPMRMASSNVTAADVDNALREQNVQVPSGQIRGAQRNYTVITNEVLDTPEEFNNLIVRHDQQQTVRLKDVGYAAVEAANMDSAFRVNQKPAVAVGIIPQSTANPLNVSHNVIKALQLIKKNLPAGMQAEVVFNQASFIESSVQHVYHSVVEAIILVLIVIFLFLASWRAAIIPIVTIPVCLIGTFAVMYWLGFTINTITLMAFVLAIGLVVDDAIVMLENIMRYIEGGMKPFQAAIQGGREIVFPIIAMTLTLAAVYLPIAATSGILSAIFKEFALTLAFAVLISGFVSLTLSPMMCSRMLTPHKKAGYDAWLTLRLHHLQTRYKTFLEKILTKRKLVLFSLLAVGLAGYGLFKLLPVELSPAEDMNEVDVYISAPRNASYQFTDAYIKKLEQIYKTIPEIESYLSDVGSWSPSRGFQFINLVPRNKRNKSASEIAVLLDEKAKELSGVVIHFSPAASPLAGAGGSEGSSIGMEIMSTSDYKELHSLMKNMIEAAKKHPGFIYLDSRLKWDGEQFELKIDREKASDMNISMQNITQTISTLLAGRTVGHYEYGGAQYDVILQMNKAALANPNIISELHVRNDNNKMVPLGSLISMRETTSPESLPHFDRLRADTLRGSLAPGYTIAEAVEALQKIAAKVLPDNAKYSFTGEAKNFLDSSGKMSMTFLLALIFIYLILVAQFESFVDPFIILLTVPFAVIGALFTLKLVGGSLNIYSEIGLVTLIGLISKHGILITEFANRLRSEGKSIHDAVVEASMLRLRPILMTTAAMTLGALPLALASGAGSETRQQIGWVVVGGMVVGTFFSLIVVPVAYTLLARLKSR